MTTVLSTAGVVLDITVAVILVILVFGWLTDPAQRWRRARTYKRARRQQERELAATWKAIEAGHAADAEWAAILRATGDGHD
jgi:hypothetical protein